MSDEAFSAFLARVRSGDEDAAADLVRRYEPVVRREVRVRLTDPSVYRLLDDQDICQSVFASFFVRAALGQYDLHDPAQLHQLLRSMARNKLAHASRRHRAQRRGGGRLMPDPVDEIPVAGDQATASRVAAGRELLERVWSLLSEEERRVAEMRGAGHGWADIARELGSTADGRRMQLSRALDRVCSAMDLEAVRA
jgi:RNA polymerase sigma-70 factor (ECF subfamily)